MLHITVICLGKLKEKYWCEAQIEYLKRLSAFAKVEIMELKEESFDSKVSSQIIKEKEAQLLKNALNKFQDAFLIVLDEHGKQFSSVDFSKKLSDLSLGGNSNFVFVIGGPLGLDDSILKMAKLKLSFSSFTFTHQMIRVFLLEQIYRAMMISTGRQYHY